MSEGLGKGERARGRRGELAKWRKGEEANLRKGEKTKMREGEWVKRRNRDCESASVWVIPFGERGVALEKWLMEFSIKNKR